MRKIILPFVCFMLAMTAVATIFDAPSASKKPLLAQERFNYGAGSISNKPKVGFGWVDNKGWSNSVGLPNYQAIPGTGLTYTDGAGRTVVSGGNVITNPGSNFAYHDRNISTALGASNTTFYMSWLFRSDFVDILGYRYLGVAYGSKNISGLDQYLVTTEFSGVTNVWAIWANNAPRRSTVEVASNTVHFVVGKIQFGVAGAGGNDIICLFADPTNLTQEPATPTHCWTNTGTRAGVSSNFSIQTGCRFEFDALRIGTSWESVTPYNP